MQKTTVALIGYGGMGEWHINTFKSLENEGFVIAGIFDFNENRMAIARERGFNTFSSVDELLADKSIDLVTIAVPNNFHKSLSIAALKAGKNVVCEKPVMMNVRELEEVLAVAEETGKVFLSHQNRRYDKDYITVKEIINSGVLGKPYMIESRVLGSRRVLCGWRGYKKSGGGMLLDWGIHLIDQLVMLIDSPVVEVECHMYNLMPGVEVDDNIKILLRFKNGISALTEVSTNCFVLLPRWHVSCLNGTAVVDDWSVNGKMVRLNNEDEMAWEESIVYTEAGPTRTMAPRPQETTETLPLPTVNPDVLDYYRTVARAIRGECQPPVLGEEMLRVMKVIDTAFLSAEKGQSIKTEI